MPLCLICKLSFHVALVLQNFGCHFFHWNGCGCFHLSKEGGKFLNIGVSKLVAQVAEPCQHGVVPEIRWKMGVNVGSFHTVRIFKQVLVDKFLDTVLPVPDWCFLAISNHTSTRWRSWNTVSLEELRQFHQYLRTDTLPSKLKLCRRGSTSPKQNAMNFSCCHCLRWTVKQFLQDTVWIVHADNG